jgi:hypothetical protein
MLPSLRWEGTRNHIDSIVGMDLDLKVSRMNWHCY